jgi:magnesium transporter
MTQQLATKECGYDWIDVTDPSAEELQQIAERYELHPASVSDCLQPGHLPKYEEFPDYVFIILRVYMPDNVTHADTVQAITGKIAIFVSDRFIITIHRKPWAQIATVASEYVATNRCKNQFHVLNVLIRKGLSTYDEPATAINQSIDKYEKKVFLNVRAELLLKELYFMKRKLDVIRRLLLLTYDIVERMNTEENANAYTRDVRDLFVKQRSLYDSMYEHANQLLTVYFNISAQRTNETMRVLTIFSVFFMPLTFIAGVYGMNFRHMPELEWPLGYPLVMGSMVVVIVVIFIWFRRKRWL